MQRFNTLVLFLFSLGMAACNGDGNSGGAAGDAGANTVGGSTVRSTAQCEAIAAEEFVTRTDLVAGAPSANAELMLRFVQFTDDHIIDDDGQAVNGLSALDVLHPVLESAMRMQEEYADEVLNNMITRINDCHALYPAEFAVITGDSADLTTVAEARRFIDNMDGSFDTLSAFEEKCVAGLPEGTPEELVTQTCTRFTGRGVADTQSTDPDPENPLFQLVLTRTAQQLLNTETAALTGRAADGSCLLYTSPSPRD